MPITTISQGDANDAVTLTVTNGVGGDITVNGVTCPNGENTDAGQVNPNRVSYDTGTRGSYIANLTYGAVTAVTNFLLDTGANSGDFALPVPVPTGSHVVINMQLD